MLTESIVKFKYFGSKLSGMRPGKLPEAGLTDDIAAMFAPGCWNEFIMPFLERFFTGLTDGKRSAHIEDLKAEHLKFLEQLNLSYYDPSVSPHLTPEIVGTESSVPFGWRLCDFHYRDMTNSDVENFVFKAAAGGASLVLSSIGHNMLTPEMVGKVHSFINAGKEAKKMLDNGVERQELLKLCSKTEKE